MNQAIKDRWIKALNSEEYKQTRGTLHNNQGFCCLGVLCDLYIQEHQEVKWVLKNDRFKLMRESGVLPTEVKEWACLEEANPIIDLGNYRASLAELNDAGRNFKEIADVIKEHL